jgi:DMSO/TMAO reductase YedYZ molybdopterin-dependent catalytic subunit
MTPDSPERISRRRFTKQTAVLTASAFAGKTIAQAAAPNPNSITPAGLPTCPHPTLTAANDFYTVARGNPKPHTLTGQALADARMTPNTWRLEITTDPTLDPPDLKLAAEIEKPLTLANKSALDYPALVKLGQSHGVKFIKAMQCLNIAEPLGQGLWEGIPLREILRLCGSMENIRRIYYRGYHNNDPAQIFQSSVSYTQAMETPPGDLPVFLAYKLNGKPIPPVRGGPVRMIVPWAHGFKSIKWLQQIFLTNDYRANDTYALRNNDPESFLKTAAYVDLGPESFPAGQPALVTGQVISGLSGLKHVEYFLRKTGPNPARLEDNDPALQRGPWTPCHLYPAPDWKSILPSGTSTRDILGFDMKTGQPLSWPLRYGMASWVARIDGLKPGHYELYARAVDQNGFAQPEPRPIKKSGKNGLQFHRFRVA